MNPGSSRRIALEQYRPDSRKLLDLVGLVYEGVNEPSPWQSFTECLRRLLAAKAVSITLHHSPELAHDIQVMAVQPGDDTDWKAAERAYRERFSHIELLHLKKVEPGQILAIESAMVGTECADYFSQLGIHGSLRTCFTEPSGEMRCWVDVVHGHAAADVFSDTTASELLDLLLPHLSRALGLYARLQRQETERGVYAASLDHLSLDCLMLDSQARILAANQAAIDIVNQHSGLAISKEHLILQDVGTQADLDQAVSHALVTRARPSINTPERLVRVQLPDGTLLGVLVAPAPVIPHYQGRHAASVILYLSELGNPHNRSFYNYDHDGASIAHLFGLTPQEGRLALLLASSKTIAEASQQIGVAVSAARNYSKNIYAKLDLRGQSDLVRLINRSLALLR